MLLKIVSVAVFAAVVGPVAAQAQTLAQIGDPAETPPGSFKGNQYVDSRGCVFLRAGVSGQAHWVPRVNKDHKVLCGLTPTFAAPAAQVAEAAPEVAAPVEAAPVEAAPVVKSAPVVVAKAPAPVVKAPVAKAPVETVASAMMPELPVVVAQSAPVVVPRYETVASGPGPGKIGCFTSAPVAEVVRLRTGGTVVVCTRGDGTMTGWRPPIYPAGSGVGAALSESAVVVTRADTVRVAVPEVRADATYAEAAPVVPKGYKLAWKDDRLNPMRGKGTAAGDAAQAAIWTEKVPARLVADVEKKKQRKAAAQVTVSSKNSAQSAAGGAWVQVGTFGVPANAAGAAQRLAALGLPVANSKLNKGGKALQIVLAGPFGSAGEAKAALAAARQAGFSDAFLR